MQRDDSTAGGAYENADLPESGELADVGDQAVGEDIRAEQQTLDEINMGIPDEAQPDSQGEEPLDAELGPDGQGDLAPEDM